MNIDIFQQQPVLENERVLLRTLTIEPPTIALKTYCLFH